MFGDVSSSPRPPSKSHKVVYLQCGSRGHQFRTSRDLKTGEDSLHCEAVQPSVAQKQFQFGPGKAALRREWWPFKKEEHLFRAFVHIYIYIYTYLAEFYFGFLSSLYCAAVLHFFASTLLCSFCFSTFLPFCFSACFLLLCIFAFLFFLFRRFFVCFSAFLLLCFFASLFSCLLFLCFLFSALYFSAFVAFCFSTCFLVVLLDYKCSYNYMKRTAPAAQTTRAVNAKGTTQTNKSNKKLLEQQEKQEQLQRQSRNTREVVSVFLGGEALRPPPSICFYFVVACFRFCTFGFLCVGVKTMM